MARQCNRGAPELALGPDHHGLPVAARGQGNVAVEPGRARQHLKTAIAAASLEGSVDAAAGFAPGPGKRSALRHHVASEVEFVAVAGADQVLVEAVSAGAHGIIGATPDALGRSVIERDDASAGPAAGHAGKRPPLGVACGAGSRRRDQGDGWKQQPPKAREGRSIAARLPIDRCTARLPTRHSIFLIPHYRRGARLPYT